MSSIERIQPNQLATLLGSDVPRQLPGVTWETVANDLLEATEQIDRRAVEIVQHWDLDPPKEPRGDWNGSSELEFSNLLTLSNASAHCDHDRKFITYITMGNWVLQSNAAGGEYQSGNRHYGDRKRTAMLVYPLDDEDYSLSLSGWMINVPTSMHEKERIRDVTMRYDRPGPRLETLPPGAKVRPSRFSPPESDIIVPATQAQAFVRLVSTAINEALDIAKEAGPQ